MDWLTEIRRLDSNKNGASEIDAVRSANARKGFIRGSDSVAATQDETPAPEVKPQTVTASDSAPTPTPASKIDASDLEDGQMLVTKDQLMSIVSAGIQKEMYGHNQKVRELQDALAIAQKETEEAKIKADADAKESERKIAAEKKQKDSLAQVFTEFGYAVPGNADASPNHSSPAVIRGNHSADSLQREYRRILEDRAATPGSSWVSPLSGEIFEQKDYREADRFMRQHRDQLRKGMEDFAKKNGLLRGKSSIALSGDSATAKTDIPPAFLDYLSSMMRHSHSPKFIFHQFANKKLELGRGPGDTIQVPRVAYSETGTSPSDWELDPTVPIFNGAQPISATAAKITLKEYGMGKNATIRPIGVPEFIMATSLLDLEAALQRNIGHNYNEFQDLTIRSLWMATTRVVYNKKGSVVDSPASVLAGDGGTITVKFLNALYAYLCALQVPAYSNGKYGLELHSNALAQLKNSLAEKNQYMEKADYADITNIFNTATQSELEKISGYEGDVCNFMIFSSNAHSLGVAGTPGAQTETVGGAAQVTRSSFAFGADTVAEATGMPMQLRRKNEDDYGRMNNYVWKSHQGFGYLDVDPALDSGTVTQQLRVVEVRSVDVEV
ncbi:MAG: hypothetical protein AB1861_08420 [Cyanobacteriota bacterium]